MLGSRPDDSGRSGRRRTAARTLGLTVAVAAGVALAGGAAGIALLANSGSGAGGHAAAARHPAAGHARPAQQVAASPLRVLSVTPAPGSRRVSGDTPVQVRFSAPLAPDSPRPVLRPSVPGRWAASGRVLTFTPDAAFAPGTTVTLRIPAGSAGVRSAVGGLLARPVTDRFSTGSYSALRLSELPGQLGYLPLS